MPEGLLAVAGLVKRFGGVAASDGVDLEVRRGEVHALIGPNGAGKTTLIHQVSGSLLPDAGTITFEGRDITRMAMHRRVAAGVARSFQVTNVFERFTVLDNVALAVQARSGSSFAFRRPAVAEEAVFAEARAVLERAGLRGREAVVAAALSHGEQRRLEVALALATRARLLLRRPRHRSARGSADAAGRGVHLSWRQSRSPHRRSALHPR